MKQLLASHWLSDNEVLGLDSKQLTSEKGKQVSLLITTDCCLERVSSHDAQRGKSGGCRQTPGFKKSF